MEFTVPKHSKSKVDRAGRVIVDPTAFSPREFFEAFLVVDNWRSSHAYPLNTFAMTLRNKAHKVDANALVAQRIKRLASIEGKLNRFRTMTLSQMQDLGGCRAIVKSVARVNRLRALYAESRFEHVLHTEDDYISRPQRSGYRGIHLIYRYRNTKRTEYDNLKIEVQLRTLLQHAWATAVETVDTFTRQALKSSAGEVEWLRFFAVMGAAMARLERTATVPETPTSERDLLREVRALAKKLDVVKRLTNYGAALKTIEAPGTQSARYFLMELNPSENLTTVTGYRASELERAEEHYLRIERSRDAGSQKDAVLVSVESVRALRKAYPNYFLDTKLFVAAVERLIAS